MRAELDACSELLGLGGPLLDTALALDAFSESCQDVGLAFAIGAHLLAVVRPVVEFGSPLADKLRSGTWLGANAITEDDAGSDVYSLTTRARRDGDWYVLNGVKSFVTNAPIADVFLVYARTQETLGYLGLSAFLVERDTPGLQVGTPLDKLGLSSTPAAPVRLEDCRVPVGCRVGQEGQGGPMFDYSMQCERAALGAVWTGDMARRLRQAVKHAWGRRQFGQPIGDNQAVSHRLADLQLRLTTARMHWQRACWRIDRGLARPEDSAMAKLAVSEAAVASSIDTIAVFGGRGFLRAEGIERCLRDAVGSTIASGTSDMQREIIARALRPRK